MPTLVRLPHTKLVMYAGDHNPPHFHVLSHDGSEAWVDIDTLAVVWGKVHPSAWREVLAWSRLNTGLLAAKWKELNP